MILPFIITVIIAYCLTGLVKFYAQKFQVVDRAQQAPHRKTQAQAVPLLGGIAIYLTFVLMIAWLFPVLTLGYLLPKNLVGIIIAGLVIIVGGSLDDSYNLPPRTQLIFPILATVIIVTAGIGPTYITNPFGGVIHLDKFQFTLFTWNNLPYHVTLVADLFTISWLLLSTYTTKLLDGLDGLVSGITVIGGLIIFVLSFMPNVNQPETGVLALILAGAGLGFLRWNFFPAKIYLGEGGALWCGFMLGVLAILSGGKIATALLILGLPLIDLVWVVIRRVWIEHKSPFAGDTLHLHFQLRLLGWSERKIVLLYYIVTLIFGLSTLVFSGVTKLIVLILLLVFTITFLGWVFRKTKKLPR